MIEFNPPYNFRRMSQASSDTSAPVAVVPGPAAVVSTPAAPTPVSSAVANLDRPVGISIGALAVAVVAGVGIVASAASVWMKHNK